MSTWLPILRSIGAPVRRWVRSARWPFGRWICADASAFLVPNLARPLQPLSPGSASSPIPGKIGGMGISRQLCEPSELALIEDIEDLSAMAKAHAAFPQKATLSANVRNTPPQALPARIVAVPISIVGQQTRGVLTVDGLPETFPLLFLDSPLLPPSRAAEVIRRFPISQLRRHLRETVMWKLIAGIQIQRTAIVFKRLLIPWSGLVHRSE